MSEQVKQLPRRRFLKTTLATAGAAVSAPMFIPSSVLGLGGAVPPSDRVVIGGIGIGNRGTYDLGCFLAQKDVQFVAVCDVKEARRTAVKKMVDTHYAKDQCETYRDFRELLDRSDIDAVLIATGPNWHATAAMNAARAGKDMYCEKPVTKNIDQSLILAETMRPYRACVSGRYAAPQPAALRLCLRTCPDWETRQAQAGVRASRRHAGHDERLADPAA